jgi:hypothetical protein
VSFSSLYKVVKGQVERDRDVVKLAATMEDVFSFVDAIESFPEKLTVLEETILKILHQTIECSIFIREYTGNGFSGNLIA